MRLTTKRISTGRYLATLVWLPVLFSGCFHGIFQPTPPLTVSVLPGACVFTDGVSSTPVTASFSAQLAGATIVLTKTGQGPVHTFPTSGTTYSASPGGYTWGASATNTIVQFNDPSNGGFTASSCPSDLIPTTASVSPGACVFNDGVSSTPVTVSVSPAGGATIVLTKTGQGSVHTFPTDGATYSASPGGYTWVATSPTNHVLSGSTTGGFTATQCKPPKIPVNTSVSPGACAFTDDVSSTPVTASIGPTSGATIVLTKTGQGPVHTFPTNGASYSATPGGYTWTATASSGYVLNGSSSGGLTATSCPPPDPSPSPSDATRR